jgi:ABC-type lipoprotein export system ATPase subunit
MVDQAHKLPAELSGGQLQRVAIARSLANDPPLLAADEPTGNLDARSADRVLRLFEALVDAGKSILMVTHDNDLARRALRTVVLADGQIVDEWTNSHRWLQTARSRSLVGERKVECTHAGIFDPSALRCPQPWG